MRPGHLSHQAPLLVHAVCLMLVMLVFAVSADGQGTDAAKYPSRPITFIVPTPAGSEADLPCRLIAKEAEKFLGQPIVVINKPGASMTIGIASIVVAKPDGYTIGHAGHPGIFFAPFMEKIPYQPVRDLKQIMQFGNINIAVFVKNDSPFKAFKDVVEFARKNPKKLTYGTSGTGTSANVAMEKGCSLLLFPLKVLRKRRQPFSADTFSWPPAVLPMRSLRPERRGSCSSWPKPGLLPTRKSPS